MKKIFGLLFLLTACDFSRWQPGTSLTIDDAKTHASKLREHFLGHRTTDLSTLIAETREISRRLKNANQYALANKFDSYSDVLMYGNNTLDESVKDVMELVKGGGLGCTSFFTSCSCLRK